MPIIRASCPSCGDVDVSPKQMKVMLCSSNGEASYSFQCPSCNMLVRKTIDRHIVEILVSAGVRMHFWKLPDELMEDREGPPIDYDDLIAFHYELGEAGWMERLERYTRDHPRSE
ncbi:MAG: hypothetical protein ACYDHP_06510 [Ferrimicrobium sp.]